MDYVKSDKVRLQLLKSFDIEVGTKLEEVPGTLLPVPTMKCGPVRADPRNGAWRNNDRFEKPMRIVSDEWRRER